VSQAIEGGPPPKVPWWRNVLVWTAIGSVAAVAGVAVAVGAWLRPFSDHVTRGPDTPLSPVAIPTPTSGESSPPPGVDGFGELVLKAGDAVDSSGGCSHPGGQTLGWEAPSTRMGGKTYDSSVTCKLWYDDAGAFLDFVVPEGAKEIRATVGMDDRSPNTTVRLEFVIRIVGGAVLATRTVSYLKPQTITAPVTAASRVRLSFRIVRFDVSPYSKECTAGWASLVLR
jgi:hypothetical protein